MKVLINNVVQFITFNVNPKLTDVTLNCSVFVINGNITDFAGKTILELEGTTISIYTDRNFTIFTVDN